MSFLVTRSIPLGETTRAAIKDNGGTFASRDRSTEETINLIQSGRWDWVWNMGNSQIEGDFALPVYNTGDTVKKLLTSAAMREFFDDLMPPQTGEAEFVWSKGYGRRGRNKEKLSVGETDLDSLEYWEDHIDGREFRVITVGDKRVQQFARGGDNANRSYRWIPMHALPSEVKLVVRKASQRLSGNSIIAWDVVQERTGRGMGSSTVSTESRPALYESLSERDAEERSSVGLPGPLMERYNRAFILEGNTCPGLNTYSVERILSQIGEQHAN